MRTTISQADFLEKQKILKNAQTILKSEFFGIDNIIDEIIDNVSSWFFLADIQEKPVVINLWGLTGVGKTSLVNRLVELIDYKNLFYKFDLGEKEGNFSFRETLNDLCESNNNSPIIIALDEIQHSRTVIGPFREEIENDKNRMIWELIDSGKIQHVEWKRGLSFFEDTIYKLSYILNAGVEITKGKVTKKIKLYCNEMNIDDFDCEDTRNIWFVPKNEYENIIRFAGDYFNLHLQQDVQNLLMSYSAKETIEFLKKVLKIAQRPTIKNFSNALIFILGNLDEAYTMSNNFSAEIDADEFFRMSKQITVPQIKKALQQRFRNEQIARLGNIHIIYPALNRKAYEKIIQAELNKFAKRLFEKFNLKISFDKSVNTIIYDEGVYPTQGVRPIFTSVHQILKSKISLFISEIFLHSIDTDELSFPVDENRLKCLYLLNETKVYEKQVNITTTLSDIRKNNKDDMQAITAVHESGHAVLSIILLKTIPDVIYSVTSDADNNGFSYLNLTWKYISRKEIIPRTAMILGGYVAEELIFGKENLTAGANSDIKKATEFLSQMFKQNGMGQLPILYGTTAIREEKDTYHNLDIVENEIRKTIEEAKQLAEITLTRERELLLNLSDYLSDNRLLKQNDIRKIIEKTDISMPTLINKETTAFYRTLLKQQIQKQESLKPSIPHFNNVLSLNKEKHSL